MVNGHSAEKSGGGTLISQIGTSWNVPISEVHLNGIILEDKKSLLSITLAKAVSGSLQTIYLHVQTQMDKGLSLSTFDLSVTSRCLCKDTNLSTLGKRIINTCCLASIHINVMSSSKTFGLVSCLNPFRMQQLCFSIVYDPKRAQYWKCMSPD